MRQILSILCLTLLIGSCTKTNSSSIVPDETNSNSIVSNGTYTGTFQRQTSNGGQISNVTITFSATTWTGQSQFAKYPALCHGTYKVNGADSITFDNDCPWTAEFDWTLILGKNYKIKTVEKSIEITRDYNGTLKDVYKLTKQ